MATAISVVVPVYNGEKYLQECLDSILAQSFRDFELVLMDDGSADASAAICDACAAENPGRVRVVHKRNEGINATRRRGVTEATGEWIAFCDQDDTMPADALGSLFALRDDTDIVIGFPDTPNYNTQLTLDQCRRNMITARLLPPSPWAKLYRRALLTPEVFDFPRGIDGAEDMIMNIRLMFKVDRAPRICFKRVYNFRRNTASVSHTSKASLYYEQLFDHTRELSIPDDVRPQYMREILWSRVNGISSVAYSEPQSIADGTHPYLLRLMADLRQYHYRLSARQWVMLHCRSVAVVRLCGLLRLVGNSLRYRLGLNN